MNNPARTLDTEALLSQRDFLRKLARALVVDEQHAEDVVQEACVAALRSPPRSPEALRGWLATVVRNVALNLRRGEARRREREEERASHEATPSTAEIAEGMAACREVSEALCILQEPYRTSVYLRYYQDLPPREIAARLAVPVETVRSRIKRGLGKLREHLDSTHEGDRRSWQLALVPFVAPLLKRGAQLQPAAGTSALDPARWGLRLAWIAPGIASVLLVWTLFSVGLDGRSGSGPAVAPASTTGAETVLGDAGSALAESELASNERRHVSASATPDVMGAGLIAFDVRLVEPRSAAPIEALTVLLTWPDGRTAQLETDADGRFSGESRAPLASIAVELVDGPQRVPVPGPRDLAALTRAPGLAIGPSYDLLLEPQGNETRAISEGLTCALFAEDTEHGWQRLASARVRGGTSPWVRFPALPALGLTVSSARSAYALRVVNEARTRAGEARVHALPGPYPRPVPLALEARTSVHGTLVDVQRTPLAGVPVQLTCESGVALTYETTTDLLGRFHLGALPALTADESRYELRVSPLRQRSLRRQLELHDGKNELGEIALESLQCTALSGTLSSRSGAHEPKGSVLLRSLEDSCRAFRAMPMLEDGAWRFELSDIPFGLYELFPPMADGLPWQPRRLVVRVPCDEIHLECSDVAARRTLRLNFSDALSGARLDSVRVTVLVDRYRLGIARAADFDPSLATRMCASGEVVCAALPADLPFQWLVEKEGYLSSSGGAGECRLVGGELVCDVALQPSWRAHLWLGTHGPDGKALPLGGVGVWSGTKHIADSLGDGHVLLELTYDPGELELRKKGWRMAEAWGDPDWRMSDLSEARRIWMEAVER